MAKKEIEPKIILERQYIVPLRRGWLKVPKYKRANKAVKTLKEFMAKHMKVYDRDLRKIKIDIILNNEIRFRGMRKPLNKIKVIAKKYDNEIVRVELVDIPKIIKYKIEKQEREKAKAEKKVEEKKVEEKKVEEKKEEKPEEIQPKPEEKEKAEETKEKEAASKEEGLTKAKMQAKEMKHVSKDKKVQIHRKALSR
jgi:large subunit ribosomal protein L31e